jgi:hypothetical protein
MTTAKSRPAIPPLWHHWLQAAIVSVALFGLLMLVAPCLTRQLFSLLIYGSSSAMETQFGQPANDYIALAHGVLGATMLGWAIAMFLALRGPFRRGRREGWLLIAAPPAAWFATDTLFSLCTGFWPNAILNSAFVIVFAIPLAATWKHCSANDS